MSATTSTSRFDIRALREPGELKAYGTELGEEIKRDDVASLAAAVSFKIVLALFPALLATVAIFVRVLQANPNTLQNLLDRFPDDFDQVTAIIQDRLPELIEQAASNSLAALVTGIALGLWAASSAALTLNKALSRAYDVAEDRKLVKARGAAFAVTLALLLALIGIVLLLVAGGAIEDTVLTSLPLTDTAETTAYFLSRLGRVLAAILLLMVLFAFIYWIGPDYDQRPSWVWITPGAAVAVVTWLVASGLFGWYVATFGSYTDTDSPYGALGGAIVFMLWLQLSMFALLLGAEINQVLVVRARRRRSAGDASGAGSVGRDENGRVPSGQGQATAGTSANSEPTRTPGTSLRAATTPVPKPRAARPGRAQQEPAAGGDPRSDRGRRRDE